MRISFYSLLRTSLIVAAATLSTGCGEGPEREARVVTDDLGREVSIGAPVRRVVTLAPSVTETVYEAGAGTLLVGASQADNHPPQVADLARFSTYPLDLERLVSLAPDLVLASDQVNHPSQVAPLIRLGIPSYFFRLRELSDLPDLVQRTGILLGTSEEATRVADSIATRIEHLHESTASIHDRPSVLVLAGARPLYAFGSESYIHDLVSLAGGRSITESFTAAAPVLSDEFVLRTQPEVIVGTDSALFTPEALLELHPTWDAVPAIANRRVMVIHPDLIYRPGPRLVEGAYQIAKQLHPELDLSGAR